MREEPATQVSVKLGYYQYMSVEQLETLCHAMKIILGEDALFSMSGRSGYEASMTFENSQWKFDQMEEEKRLEEARKQASP